MSLQHPLLTLNSMHTEKEKCRRVQAITAEQELRGRQWITSTLVQLEVALQFAWLVDKCGLNIGFYLIRIRWQNFTGMMSMNVSKA